MSIHRRYKPLWCNPDWESVKDEDDENHCQTQRIPALCSDIDPIWEETRASKSSLVALFVYTGDIVTVGECGDWGYCHCWWMWTMGILSLLVNLETEGYHPYLIPKPQLKYLKFVNTIVIILL